MLRQLRLSACRLRSDHSALLDESKEVGAVRYSTVPHGRRGDHSGRWLGDAATAQAEHVSPAVRPLCSAGRVQRARVREVGAAAGEGSVEAGDRGDAGSAAGANQHARLYPLPPLPVTHTAPSSQLGSEKSELRQEKAALKIEIEVMQAQQQERGTPMPMCVSSPPVPHPPLAFLSLPACQ
ncbi:unnamed protein product [Closterium sp. Naga37s-1]|nr:unnamed protein product [Closterium sp. Naga37s-1]